MLLADVAELHLHQLIDHDAQDDQGQLPRDDEADDQSCSNTGQVLQHHAQTCTCHLMVQNRMSLFVGSGGCEWWGFKGVVSSQHVDLLLLSRISLFKKLDSWFPGEFILGWSSKCIFSYV